MSRCLKPSPLGRMSFMAALIAVALAGAQNAVAFIPNGIPEMEDRAPAAGKFLVASRDIQDPRFRKTVILLLKHDSNGSLGLIVNRPSKVRLSEIFPEQESERPGTTVFFGGPVHPALLSMLVRTEDVVEEQDYLLDNVYSVFGTQHVTDAMDGIRGSDDIRVYSGYAGWSSGQLESELQRGGWHVAPADPALVFSSDPDGVWNRLIKRFSGQWT